MKELHVTYRPDPESDGQWLVHVNDDDRLHSHGRTIRSARTAIREVIDLWYGDGTAAAVELVETFDLRSLAPAADEAVTARRELAVMEKQVADKTRMAARQLVDSGVSLRDAAEVLGITHQRVHQLVS